MKLNIRNLLSCFSSMDKTHVTNSHQKQYFKINSVILFFSISIGMLYFLSSCKKLVDTKAPETSLNAANVYESDGTASAVLTGIFGDMSANQPTTPGLTGISFFCALSADELTLHNAITSTELIPYYKNSLTSNTSITPWTKIYPVIFYANSAIEGITNSNNLSPLVKKQLLGEAKFVRAFCYFYLVNLFGDLPLALSTDYTTNSTLSRTSKSNVYNQIIMDLKECKSLLNDNYVKADAINPYQNSAIEKVRPNKSAAIALLARVYLYSGDYDNAEIESTTIINNSSQYQLGNLSDVFLKNSSEAIWQLQPVVAGWNTLDARLFIIPETGPSSNWPVFLSDTLLNSFEPDDKRLTSWIDSVVVTGTTYHFPAKYKSAVFGAPVTEYLMVLRLSEQYLIRAEARAYKGDLGGSSSDLNIIRNRAGLPNTIANDKASLLSAILHERQVELFTEWGHRWLDLKKALKVDDVMNTITPQKEGSWETSDQLYPLPLNDIQKNSNLTQNPGY